MTWQELLHDEKYLTGLVLCIHHHYVYPELHIYGNEKDFYWARRPEMALVCKGPVEKFVSDATTKTFAVYWMWMHILTPDFVDGVRLKNAEETKIPDCVIVRAHNRPLEPTKFGVIHLGTAEDITDVYLLPGNYEFPDPWIPPELLEI